MILLLGGTSETDPMASALVEKGFSVLVSTMTDYPLKLRTHARMSRRTASLDRAGLSQVIRQFGIHAIVDATHPYAELIGTLARSVARDFGLPYLRYLRPSQLPEREFIQVVSSHVEAARTAVLFGVPILLTVGSKHLAPYARAAHFAKVPLIARVLDLEASTAACAAVGIVPAHIIVGKGPFSVEENIAQIERFDIGVLVTKDSGKEGGVPEKIAAAEATGCRVTAVRRPPISSENTFGSIENLVSQLLIMCYQ